jgi:DNA-directed RNA polymerase sigma subunit (sigma70/sigma32)
MVKETCRAVRLNSTRCPLEIVTARWLGDDKITLDVLGRRYGISRERVRQIEERAMRKMKAAVARLPEDDTGAAAMLPA